MENLTNFEIGTKIQSYDKDGYYVMNACGVIESNLGGGHYIIKTFSGNYYSTVGQNRIFEIEQLKN